MIDSSFLFASLYGAARNDFVVALPCSLLIIPTVPYTESEMTSILKLRMEEEDVEMTEEAREYLTQVAKETSLRYAIHLITMANLKAKKRKVCVLSLFRCAGVFQRCSVVFLPSSLIHASDA
jgi:DNA helicase TIP49 (TBP-interacting protein)